MPTETETKVSLSDVVVALRDKGNGDLSASAEKALIDQATAAGKNARNAAVAAVFADCPDAKLPRAIAISRVLNAIVSTTATRKVDVDPMIAPAYVAAAVLVMADRIRAGKVDLPEGDRDAFAAYVVALVDQKVSQRDDTFTGAIDDLSSRVANATTGKARYPGRSLANIPDGTVFTYQKGKATVQDGQLIVGGKAFSAPSPAAKAAAKSDTSVDGWRAFRHADGRTLHDHAMP